MTERKILLVHESEDTRSLIAGYIRSELNDIVIEEVETASDAERILEQEKFDVVMSNVLLPEIKHLRDRLIEFVILLTDDSPALLKKLKAHGIEHYLSVPFTPEKLKFKIDEICNPRKKLVQKRYSVTGTKAILHMEGFDYRAVVVNFSNNSIMCEVDVHGEYNELLKEMFITVEFPRSFGNKVLKKIWCKQIFVKVLRLDAKRRPGKVQIIWSFLKVNEENDRYIKSLIQIAEERNKKTISWNQNRLEIKLGSSIYLFYKVHLFRIGLLFLTVFLILGFFLIDFKVEIAQDIDVLWAKGNAYYRLIDTEDWKPLVKKTAPETAVFKVGDPAKTVLNKKSKHTTVLNELAKERLILRYSPFETVILAKGSQVIRKEQEDGTLNYLLQGAVHLLLEKNKDKPFKIKINNVLLSGQDVQIFYQDVFSSAELSVNEGILSIPPQKDRFVHAPKYVEIESGEIKLSNKHVMLIGEKRISFVEKGRRHQDVYLKTFVPGFNTFGEFKRVGTAIRGDKAFQFERHGKTITSIVANTPLMEGDKIINKTEQPILLTFPSNHRILVFSDSELLIKEFPLKRTKNALEIPDGTEKYQFLGQIRVNIVTPSKNRSAEFKTVKGIVKAKKAEFEAWSNNTFVEVLGVTGQVSLGIDGEEPVNVYRGKMARREGGGAVSKSVKIPPARLVQLISESFTQGNGYQLSSYSTVSLDNLVLKNKRPLVMYWNKPVIGASILLSDVIYPLTVDLDGMMTRMDRKLFPNTRAGNYPVKLLLENSEGKTIEISTELNVKSDINLDVICGVLDRGLRSEQRSVVRRFQRRAGLKVDGILGSETKNKIQEIRDCRMDIDGN